MHEHGNQQHTKHGLSFKIYEKQNEKKKQDDEIRGILVYNIWRSVIATVFIFCYVKSQPNSHTPQTHLIIPSTVSKLEL